MTTSLTFSHFRIFDNINKFFFKPASSTPLATLRIGLSALLLLQAFIIRKSFLDIFANYGFVQGEVSNTFVDPSLPQVTWFVELLSYMGVNENQVLIGFGILYIVSLLSLLFGYFSRASAFLAWFLNWAFINTGYSGAYGVDLYIHFLLFYLIFAPTKFSSEPSWQARLSLRVLQLHMCISYLASGLEKTRGEQWWNGEVMWRALTIPGYSIADFYWLAKVPFIPMALGWTVLALEIFYFIFIWPQKTRYWWVFFTCLMHIGIAIFLKLHIFGILMCIPTIALFAVPYEPGQSQNFVKVFSYLRN